MKTPGHAMTAQAGAVACDVVLPDGSPVARRVDISYADELLREYARSDCQKANFLYTTPPAAMPVEALEGLVAKWAEDASRMLDDAENMRDDDPRAARLLISMAEQQVRDADELTQLIKERSNG